DQMTCLRPAAFAARAIAAASAFSLSTEKWSQKNVTQKAPYAPSNARRRLASSWTSASTTSAPAAASAFALSEVTVLVHARARTAPGGAARLAWTTPLPCAPVSPTTAITFRSAIHASSQVRTPLHHTAKPGPVAGGRLGWGGDEITAAVIFREKLRLPQFLL